MHFLKKVLNNIKPTKEEEKKLEEITKKILNKINSILDSQKAILGGSGIKGTWLKNEYDIDIFVLFDYKKFQHKSDSLANVLEKKLRKAFSKLKKLHGSRDYFQIKEKGFDFEIVPLLEIKKSSQAKNITDVSPLHAIWVKKQIKKNPEFVDEIRLLKQFCKSANVYGAESYIKGFSGYICEILTIYYGSFLNVIKNASKWEDKVIIDVEGNYKGKDALKILNKSKIYSPLIVIDPVQKDRNASAAISKEKFVSFKLACKKFLEKPSINFFLEKKISVEDIKKLAGKDKLILISAEPLEGKQDIIGCKLLNVFEFFSKRFAQHDFKIKKKGWHWEGKNDAIYYFIFKKAKLPKFKKHQGPLISLTEHVKGFKKAHKKTFIEGKRICAYIKREFTKPEKLARRIIIDKYIKVRVNSIKLF